MRNVLVPALIAAAVLVTACGGGSSPSKALAARLTQYNAASFSISYQASVEPAGSKSTVRLSKDGPTRQSVLVTNLADNSWLQVLITPENFALCTSPSAAGGAGGSCVGGKGAAVLQKLRQRALEAVGTLSNPLPVDDLAGYSVSTAKARSLLGKNADCFSLVRKDDKASTVEACFSDAALVYRDAGSAGGHTILEATDVVSPATPTDFDLPYPLTAP